ncbi:hypothetical protein BGZ88_011935 [Linnemannia elongata]|nr:hypothetical protein BGZ88_011935 [Linnemannia elongata]
MTRLHITLLPEEVFFHLLPFLDLPDHHSLLLTCRSLFYKVVPALYRSPFRLLLAYNGKTPSHPLSPNPTSSSSSTFPPIASTSASYSYSSSLPSYSSASDPSSLIPTSSLYSTTRTTITPATATLTTIKVARSNSSIDSNDGAGNGIGGSAGGSGSSMRHSSRRHTGNPHSLRKASASSVSSTSTSSTSSSSTHTAATVLTTAASSYSPPSARPTGTSGPFPVAIATATATASASASTPTTPRPVHPSSLHQRSLSDHPKGFNPGSIGTSHSDTTSAHSKARLSIITHHNQQQQSSSTRPTGTATAMALTPQRDGRKLKKMSRLLQLLIACTSIQARLPALRYPGYGQQWIRPPCKVDYLLYYTDQQEGGEIMVQCFHLLFADLVQCRWEDEARGLGVPLGPPDKEAYKVLYQIQREFMVHHPAGIRTLSVSAVHTIDYAITLAPQLGRVSRLELTDLELEFKVEKVVDFIKSHRMVFGPVLKELSLKKKQTEGEICKGSGASSPGPTRGAGGGYQVSNSAASLFSFGSAGSPISSTATFPPHPTPAGIIAATGGGGGIPSSTSPPVALIQSLINFPRSATTSSMASSSSVMSVVQAIKGLERLDATNWDDCVLYLDRLPSSSLKRLWLSSNTPSSTSPDYTQAEQQLVGLADQLKQWRQLEEIKMPIRKGNVFAWAANEKRSALICAPILAGSRTKRLPKMRQIHLEGPTLDVVDSVRDAAFAFQATLEDLEARSRIRVWHPTTIEWGWRMPRLTRLTLEGEISLYFSLDALNRCPALEELTLATSMRHQHHHYRQDQPPLSPLPHLARGANPGGDLLLFIRSQEIRSIASLKNLQRLSLHGAWQVPDRVLRRIADQCLKLKELRLDQTVGTTIGGVLLGVENMQRLERLELRLNVVDLSLVRVVTRKLAFLSSIQLTSLRTVD